MGFFLTYQPLYGSMVRGIPFKSPSSVEYKVDERLDFLGTGGISLGQDLQTFNGGERGEEEKIHRSQLEEKDVRRTKSRSSESRRDRPHDALDQRSWCARRDAVAVPTAGMPGRLSGSAAASGGSGGAYPPQAQTGHRAPPGYGDSHNSSDVREVKGGDAIRMTGGR